MISVSKSGLLLILTTMTVACGDRTEPVQLYVSGLDFINDPAVNNRFDYEISGEDFEAEHVLVSERVFTVGHQAQVNVTEGRLLIAEFDEPAPHRRASPMNLRVSFGQAEGFAVAKLVGTVQGVLRSTTDPDWPEVEVLNETLAVEASASIEMSTDVLPSRTDLYELELQWTLQGEDCADACPSANFVTRHLIPTLWRNPRSEAPRYKRALLWSAQFGVGDWVDEGAGDPVTLESEAAISLAMLKGFATLSKAAGKSYGAFRRPDYDGMVDGVDVWLDFPRSACGEFKHGLMAMIEYQGIDAKWGVLEFLKPGPDVFSQYVTYNVPALGRDAEVWYYTNHAFTTVNGQVYDPSYNGHAETVDKYEDQLFAQFCYGQTAPCETTADWCDDPPAEGVYCIDNPPGYDPELGFVYYEGDTYR